MDSRASYLPKYQNSCALVIGINDYIHCSPLGEACNDARAVAAVLVEKFRFPNENVSLLLNEEATKAGILKTFLKHANTSTAHADDRGLVFFAGHGHTTKSRRGEVGYLVPVEGD